MDIRTAQKEDLNPLLALYTQLHDNPMPELNESLDSVWTEILKDQNHHVVVGFVAGKLVSSCVIVVIPNLTHHQQPYALIENVITHEAYRGNGYATAILEFAKEIAIRENCYKIMLLTGSKKESTLHFYERAGYNRNDKTAFIQWL